MNPQFLQAQLEITNLKRQQEDPTEEQEKFLRFRKIGTEKLNPRSTTKQKWVNSKQCEKLK